MRTILFALAIAAKFTALGQGHDLVGYWHNWNDGSAPYIQLDAIDPRYTVIEIAFAEPQAGTTYDMVFTPSGTAQGTFVAQVADLQAQGKKVLISIGGANATVQLANIAQRDDFISSVLAIIATYGFDGIDIDLEGASVSSTGGTIATPVDGNIIRLIEAIEAIGDQFQITYGTPMMLTMAPETAYVQGGMSAFGGIWGAYLPIIDALRDRISILQVQLYNSGSMYGIDGGIYTQGTADFIVSQTEAVLQGFNTAGGAFAPLPPEKVAIGLPACPSAAGGGYVSPAVLASAVDYLRGTGPQPGSYVRVSTYPTLRGLMTWSINWDAVSTCAASYEYADSYEVIFGVPLALERSFRTPTQRIWPSPIEIGEALNLSDESNVSGAWLIDVFGKWFQVDRVGRNGSFLIPATLRSGAYTLRVALKDGSTWSGRLIVVANP